MVICLMPLVRCWRVSGSRCRFALTISCYSRSRLVLPSWFYLSGAGSPRWSPAKSKRAVKRLRVCVRTHHCYPIISCFSKIQNDSIFLVPAYPGCPGKKAIKRKYSSISMWIWIGPFLYPIICTSFLLARCPSCQPTNSIKGIKQNSKC